LALLLLAKIQAADLTLNKEKCEFNKERVPFLGHVIDNKTTNSIIVLGAPHQRKEEKLVQPKQSRRVTMTEKDP